MAFDKAVDSTALNAGLTKIADAIRAKGDTEGTMAFPDGFAEMIQAIGRGRRIEEGEITLVEEQSSCIVTRDAIDALIFFESAEEKKEYSENKYIWVSINIRAYDLGDDYSRSYVWGYNTGTKKYFAPHYYENSTGRHRIGTAGGNFNGEFGATTYKWYAIYPEE